MLSCWDLDGGTVCVWETRVGHVSLLSLMQFGAEGRELASIEKEEIEEMWCLVTANLSKIAYTCCKFKQFTFYI